MDSIEKSLIKLLAEIESSKNDDLLIKPFYHGIAKSLHCFEILFSNKVKNEHDFACTFYFDCHTMKIYLEDYGTLYTSRKEISTKIKESFKKSIHTLIKILEDFPEIKFKLIQTTSRIPEKFELLQQIGFVKKEQLNHYENFKFVLPLEST